MDLKTFTSDQLLRSLEAECAKALSEAKTCQSDLNKVCSRLSFLLAVIHILKERQD